MNAQEMNTQNQGQTGSGHGMGTQGSSHGVGTQGHTSPGGATSQPKSSGVSHTGRQGDGLANGEDRQQHSEGMVARTIEKQTAKLPSDVFLWAAIGSMGVSAVLEFTGHQDKSRFVGQWAAPFLLFGVYNKIVKTQGSDRTQHAH